jgi:hypothetical protein
MNLKRTIGERWTKEMTDIMIRTRAYGMCVEAYFQAFGTKHHG